MIPRKASTSQIHWTQQKFSNRQHFKSFVKIFFYFPNRSVRPAIARQFASWMIRIEIKCLGGWEHNLALFYLQLSLACTISCRRDLLLKYPTNQLSCVLFHSLHRGFLLRSTESTILKCSRIIFRLGNATRLVFSIDMILMCCLLQLWSWVRVCQWCAWLLGSEWILSSPVKIFVDNFCDL